MAFNRRKISGYYSKTTTTVLPCKKTIVWFCKSFILLTLIKTWCHLQLSVFSIFIWWFKQSTNSLTKFNKVNSCHLYTIKYPYETTDVARSGNAHIYVVFCSIWIQNLVYTLFVKKHHHIKIQSHWCTKNIGLPNLSSKRNNYSANVTKPFFQPFSFNHLS